MDIEDNFVESIFQKISYARKITNLKKNNKFNRSINFFQQCDSHFKSDSKKYPPNKVRIEIRNNRFQIRTKEDLAMFLRICNEDYVESIINNNAYVARSKDPIS